MRTLATVVAATALAAALLATGPASAHHSEAAFDTTKVVAFQGAVDRLAWRNPHVYVSVDVENGNGETVRWEFETGSTPIMARSGWTPQSLQPKELITVRGHPDRNGRPYAILLSLEKPDGTVLTQNPLLSSGAARASTISGVWRGNLPTIEAYLERYSVKTLTEKGAAAKAAYDFRRDNPAAQCLAPPSPDILAAAVLYLSEIELGANEIVMRSEFYDVERTIYMDGRPHPENGERTNQGHSIGWWEGDTLVVDTTLFADHRSGNGEGVPSGAERHLVERFTLSDNGTRMLIDISLEDPEYLAEPFEGSFEWVYAPDFDLYEYNCEVEVSQRFFRN